MRKVVARDRGGSGPLRERLAGIDGLRAFAALWVVLFHMRAFSGAHFSGVLRPIDLFLRSGSTGVSLFLVISGFCLYLPFAHGRQGRFKTSEFFVRRIKRLMPAYYASLACFLLLLALAGGGLGFPALAIGPLGWQALTHATMTHTWFPSSFYAINGAYWSLGLEWQLYLALPLLIVGIRRIGLMKTALAAVLVNVLYRLALAGLLSHGALAKTSLLSIAVLPNQLPGRWAEFVLGMIAAELYASGRLTRWWPRAGAGWMLAAPLALLPLSLLAVGNPLSHLLFGAVFFLLLCVVLAAENPVQRAFSWRPLVAVGIMSYSLYLVHQPLVQAAAALLHRTGHLSPTATFIALLLLLPVILAVAWALFTTVERHTLSPRPRPAQVGPAVAQASLRWGQPEPVPSRGPI